MNEKACCLILFVIFLLCNCLFSVSLPQNGVSVLVIVAFFVILTCKVSKGAKIRNQYNQIPHLTQDTNWKVTNSQFDTTNESQEVSLFQAGDHKAHINRRINRHSKHKTENT